MNRMFLAASLTALCVTALAAHAAPASRDAPAPAKSADQERYEAELRRYQEERYQTGVRDAEAARQSYEAAIARHQRQLEEHRQEEAEIRQRPEREARAAAARDRRAAEDANAASAATASSRSTSATAGGDCEQRSQRNRRRGRSAGGLLGGLARTFTPIGGVAGAITGLLPVGELLGEAIAGLLDCDEQQKAATATEEAVRGGVGTTTTWTSETRPGVTGSSTMVAAERSDDGADCMTVTDVVIVEGEETRAPKRMCRRPPSSRYVRV